MIPNARTMLRVLTDVGQASSKEAADAAYCEDDSLYYEMACDVGWMKEAPDGQLYLTLRGQLQLRQMSHAWSLLAPVTGGHSDEAVHESFLRMIKLTQGEEMWARRAALMIESFMPVLVWMSSTGEMGELTTDQVMSSLGCDGERMMLGAGAPDELITAVQAHMETLPGSAVARGEQYLYLSAQIAWAYAPLIREEFGLSIERLRVDQPIIDALWQARIRTLYGLCQRSEAELLKLEGLTQQELDEIKLALKRMGRIPCGPLSLRDDPQAPRFAG